MEGLNQDLTNLDSISWEVQQVCSKGSRSSSKPRGVQDCAIEIMLICKCISNEAEGPLHHFDLLTMDEGCRYTVMDKNNQYPRLHSPPPERYFASSNLDPCGLSRFATALCH